MTITAKKCEKNIFIEKSLCLMSMGLGLSIATSISYNLNEYLIYFQAAVLGVSQSFLFWLLSQNSSYTKEVNYKVIHDELSGLLNRYAFNTELTDCINAKENIAVLFIDLDEFKKINDTYGHGIGDLLIKSVSSRMVKTVRPFDRVFRIGGDEIAVIIKKLNNKTKKDVTSQVAKRILTAISDQYNLNGTILKITCSIGISFYPEDGDTITELTESADRAMYQAKTGGKNGYR